MATCWILSFQVSDVVDIQTSTSATVRPSAWPSRPPVPSAPANPMCHWSHVSCHLPVSRSRSQRVCCAGSGRYPAPRPRAAALRRPRGQRSGRRPSRSTRTDADRRRPGRPWSRHPCIRRPAVLRSLPVRRTPAGICGIRSANDFRGQTGSRQSQRRLCHKSSNPRSPYGRSRGWVVAEPFTRDEKALRVGQARAEVSAVARWTRRQPSSHRSTRMTDTPSRSSSNVVSFAKPVAPQ
jgi:hypothetical protein